MIEVPSVKLSIVTIRKMAPITASVTGFPPQQIDTERLRLLKESLCAIKEEESDDLLARLAECVEPWTKWLVEEQVSISCAANTSNFKIQLC